MFNGLSWSLEESIGHRKWQGSKEKQEAQLMLTKPRDAFKGQSRSMVHMVPFDMLGVSVLATVT